MSVSSHSLVKPIVKQSVNQSPQVTESLAVCLELLELNETCTQTVTQLLNISGITVQSTKPTPSIDSQTTAQTTTAQTKNPQPEVLSKPYVIQAFVDGRGLACPMPLLKTKVALRNLEAGKQLYVVATDANSQHDIKAFAKQSNLTLCSWQSHWLNVERSEDLDLYHFLLSH